MIVVARRPLGCEASLTMPAMLSRVAIDQPVERNVWFMGAAGTSPGLTFPWNAGSDVLMSVDR
jgi:hypothetical protein